LLRPHLDVEDLGIRKIIVDAAITAPRGGVDLGVPGTPFDRPKITDLAIHEGQRRTSKHSRSGVEQLHPQAERGDAPRIDGAR